MEFPFASLIDYVSGVLSLALAMYGAVVSSLTFIKVKRQGLALERERMRMNEKILITLRFSAEGEEKTKILPLYLSRREVSRAEILGRIGMMPMRNKGARFSLAYTSSPKFLEQISKAQESEGEFVFEIPATVEEIEQFA